MSLFNVAVTLICIGVLMWAVNAYIPMAEAIKKVLNIVVILAVIWWLLRVFGVLDRISGFPVGR
jgi:hypothetical protein